MTDTATDAPDDAPEDPTLAPDDAAEPDAPVEEPPDFEATPSLAEIAEKMRSRLGLDDTPDDATDAPQTDPDAADTPSQAGTEEDPAASGEDVDEDADAPAADTTADAPAEPAADTPPPADEPTQDPSPDDDWARVGAALEQTFGERPDYDAIVQLNAAYLEQKQLVDSLQQLPPDQQQMVNEMLAGQFDISRHAPKPRDDYGYLDDPTPATQQRPDEVVQAIQGLQQTLTSQQTQQQYAQTEAEVTRAAQDFMAETGLDLPTVRQIHQAVINRGVWNRTGQPAYDSFLDQMRATATLNGYTPSQPAAAAAQPPAPADTPAPAPSPEDQAKAEARAAKAASIGGSSTPSRPPRKRRSPLGNGTTPPADRAPANRGELQAAMADQLQRLRGN